MHPITYGEAPSKNPMEMMADCLAELLRLELPLLSAPSAHVAQLAARAVEITQELDVVSGWLEGLEPAEEREVSASLTLAAMRITGRLARGGMEPRHAQLAALHVSHLLAIATGRVRQIWTPPAS